MKISNVFGKMETVEDCQKFGLADLKAYLSGLSPLDTNPFILLEYEINREKVSVEIALTKTPCFFGGFRWWIVCPGCQRRAGVLYKPYHTKFFLCRRCHCLTYYQRQIRRSCTEFLWQTILIRRRVLKIIEGVGQKGLSKQEAKQLQRLIMRLRL